MAPPQILLAPRLITRLSGQTVSHGSMVQPVKHQNTRAGAGDEAAAGTGEPRGTEARQAGGRKSTLADNRAGKRLAEYTTPQQSSFLSLPDCR